MTSPITQAKIFAQVTKVDAVICDAAPNLTGNWGLDHGRSINLSTIALNVAINLIARRKLPCKSLPGRPL